MFYKKQKNVQETHIFCFLIFTDLAYVAVALEDVDFDEHDVVLVLNLDSIFYFEIVEIYHHYF